MQRFTPNQWVDHLRCVARPVPPPDAPLGAGALDAPFRMAVCGSAVEHAAAPATRGEIALWWARVDERVEVDGILAAPRGPLLPRDLFDAVEVWTDAELASVHVLWWLARLRDRPDWSARVASARDWHVEHTQPDNATNRPWGLHVFALADIPECTHYAGTLLHNCLALSGRPDPLSAWILIDAARAIEQAAGGGLGAPGGLAR